MVHVRKAAYISQNQIACLNETIVAIRVGQYVGRRLADGQSEQGSSSNGCHHRPETYRRTEQSVICAKPWPGWDPHRGFPPLCTEPRSRQSLHRLKGNTKEERGMTSDLLSASLNPVRFFFRSVPSGL